MDGTGRHTAVSKPQLDSHIGRCCTRDRNRGTRETIDSAKLKRRTLRHRTPQVHATAVAVLVSILAVKKDEARSSGGFHGELSISVASTPAGRGKSDGVAWCFLVVSTVELAPTAV